MVTVHAGHPSRFLLKKSEIADEERDWDSCSKKNKSFRLCLKDYRLSFFVCTPDSVCIQGRELHSIAPELACVTRLEQRVVTVPHPLLPADIYLPQRGIRSHRQILTAPRPQTGDIGKNQRIHRVITHDAYRADRMFSRGIGPGIDIFREQRTKVGVYGAREPVKSFASISRSGQRHPYISKYSRPRGTAPITSPLGRVER